MSMERFDYIIIGAGSAGCVLAGELSKDASKRILLLEAGGPDRSPWLHLPVGYSRTFYHPQLNWMFYTVAEEALKNRVGYWPRGRVVGGSGAINALVYARGLPRDFDDWQSAGAAGWGWSDVLPAYHALETNIAADGRRSGTGPLSVQDVSDQRHPVTDYFFAAAAELGLPHCADYNEPPFEGAGCYRLNIFKGLRNASSRAFLKPALRRGTLQLRCHALADKINFSAGRARSVSYSWRGASRRAQADAEIIIAAGAVLSPLLLQRSGIGDGALLTGHGIRPVVDNANVGAHLQDHLGVNYYFKSRLPTLNEQLHSWPGRLAAALQWLAVRRGPLALSVNQCGGFFRSRPELEVPDQQLYFNPISYSVHQPGPGKIINTDPFAGFILGFQPMRPTSRGHICLSGPDPEQAPVITPGSLSTQDDCASVVDGARLCRALIRTRALQGLIDAPLISDISGMSDDEMLDDFRARCGTVFHPVGTCRMGADARDAVVDSHLRVFGVEGLRVADASVFPAVTSANTNAPTMMLALRAAGFIRADAQ